MRRWILLAAAVVLALGAALTVVLFNFNAYLARNKDWIAERAEAALGRTVRFEGIEVSLRGGFGANLTGLRVGDDPAFSAEDFLRVEVAHVAIRPWPALFGRYEAERLVLMAPVVNVVRTTRGFNFASLGRPRARQRPAEEAAPTERAPPEDAPYLPPAVLLSLADLRDGRVRILDHTTQPPTDLTLHHVDVHASDVSLTKPVAVRAAAALATATRQHLRLEGTVGPLAVEAVPFDFDLVADPLDLGMLQQAVSPIAAGLPPGLAVAGPVSVRAHAKGVARGGVPEHLTLDAQLDGGAARVAFARLFAKPERVPLRLEVAGTPDGPRFRMDRLALRCGDVVVNGKGTVTPGTPVTVALAFTADRTSLSEVAKLVPALTGTRFAGTAELDTRVDGPVGPGVYPMLDGTVTLADVGVHLEGHGAVSGVSTQIRLEGHSAVLPPTRFLVEGAPVEASATVASFVPPVRFQTHASLDDVPLEKLRVGAHVRGRLDANVDLAGGGASGDEILGSLRGQGRVEAVDGLLADTNLVEGVLGAVATLPGLTSILASIRHSRHAAILDAPGTRFDKASATFAIADRRVTTNDAVLSAAHYTMRGRGWVDFDQRVDVTATLIASPGLTRELVSGVKEIRWLGESESPLAIPFRLQGTWPNVRPVPDARALAANLTVGTVRSGVDALIGTGKRAGKAAGKGAEKVEEPAQKLLRRGLDSLFGR
jgi:hypothetical protein